MKILSSQQIREADLYTIEHEPVASIELMERAARAFMERFMQLYSAEGKVMVICGMGNNGGDGLAVTRMLLKYGYDARAYILKISDKLSSDAATNLSWLGEDQVQWIEHTGGLPEMSEEDIIIDAIFGTGLNRPAEGLAYEVIQQMNPSGAEIVSIDMPSGLFADKRNEDKTAIVKAAKTLTFQLPKLSFLMCENTEFTGEWEVLDIGLSQEFINQAETKYQAITGQVASCTLKPRDKCGHKGVYGHSLIIAGSYGKIGAAVLCGRACLRTGTGLLTIHAPSCGYEILQTALPEAMASTDEGEVISMLPDLEPYNAIGCGPGLGREAKTAAVIEKLLQVRDKKTVLDADALNILSENKGWYKRLSKNHILTPHPKEFERLAGACENDWERFQKATAFVREFGCTLVLKSAYTSIHLPDGRVWFNTTGNPGMGTGGTGDALTGMITALLAQGYSTEEAAIPGVYLHGRAGDLAAEEHSQWAMTAGDLVDRIGGAFNLLSSGLE